MKVLRILLQLVIVSAGGITLAALISRPPPDLTAIVFFFGFMAFLLALTLMLKEHTKKRLVPGYALSLKPIGIVLLLLGAFGIFYGVSFFTGNQPLPDGSGTCRTICGLILLASQLFGEKFARFFAFVLWTSMGLLLCFVGHKLKKTKEN